MRFDWNQPPGATAPSSIRRSLKTIVSSLLVGVMSVGVAWAGIGLVPINDRSTDHAAPGVGNAERENWLGAADEGEDGSGEASASAPLEPLQANQVYAGAFKVNIAPQPGKYEGTWETDREHCETMKNPQETEPTQLTDFRVRWHENTNCIYTGGYDLGPENAVSSFDEEYGLWARATAISDGDDTVVLLILDASYYFAKYANMCNTNETHKSVWDGDHAGANQYTQDCGFRDLQHSLAEKYGYSEGSRGRFGIEPASFFLASSHAHATPDFIGAWGGVPRWYMQQVEDAIREAVYGAIDSMEPAYVEAGEILFRGGNESRRRHYHAAEEMGAAWMRFVAEEDAEPICTDPTPEPNPGGQVAPGQEKKLPEPTCTQPPPNRRAVATIGTYAAHPVYRSNGVAFADMSGVFAKGAEERFGGTGLFFQTGFGNMTSAYDRRQLGNDLVAMLPELGAGQQVTDGLDVRVAMRTFDQPVTNSVLAAGGMSGIFDRPMEQRPSAVSVSKNSLMPGDALAAGDPEGEHAPHKRCNSASPVTVNSQVSAARIGPVDGGLLITGGPGELFSNYTNTIKEKNTGGITFPLSLVNDGLGYIMQSFETDHAARQGVGFGPEPLTEYEDAYSIDACFGDHTLEQTLAAIREL